VFGGLANLGNLMKQAQQMGGRIEEIGANLKAQRLNAESADGLVRVEANGLGEILKLTIDPTLLETGDTAALETLVPETINQVLRRARELHANEIRSLTSGLGLPGMDEALSRLTNLGR
jgi:DNA-binding YbaB/EbfC family protein